MTEQKNQPLAPFGVFLRRLARNFLVSLGVVAFSLTIGTAGYCYFGELPVEDGFLNASMILGGMGPIGDLPCDGAKWFASFYALYSGIALLTTVAVMLAPLTHRLLHRLHLDDE